MTRSQGIMPQAHTGLPAHSLTYLHPLCSQAKQVAFAHPWVQELTASSIRLQLPADTPLQPQLPPFLFLQGSYTPSLACPLSPAFLKQPPKDKSWSSGIPLHLSQSGYPFLSRGMIFIQAIFFSFLPCIFSSSTASFKFAFPVSSTEPGWESKL